MGRGAAWAACAAEHDRIKACLDQGLTLVKVAELLGRRGVVVPYRTLHRYAAPGNPVRFTPGAPDDLSSYSRQLRQSQIHRSAHVDPG